MLNGGLGLFKLAALGKRIIKSIGALLITSTAEWIVTFNEMGNYFKVYSITASRGYGPYSEYFNLMPGEKYYFEMECPGNTSYSIQLNGSWISYNEVPATTPWTRTGMLIDYSDNVNVIITHYRNGVKTTPIDGRWHTTSHNAKVDNWFKFDNWNNVGDLFKLYFDPSTWTEVGNLNVKPIDFS